MVVFLDEGVDLVLEGGDVILEIFLPVPVLALERLEVVLLVGEFLLELLDPGVLLALEEGELVLELLDELLLLIIALEEFVAGGCELVLEALVLLGGREEIVGDFGVLGLVLLGRGQPADLLLQVAVLIYFSPEAVLVVLVQLRQLLDLHGQSLTLLRWILSRLR